MAYELYTNNAVTTLTGTVNNSSDPVTLAVVSAGLFPATGNFHVLIGAELLKVTSVSGTNFTASRAQNGTTIASHAISDQVILILCENSLKNIVNQVVVTDDLTELNTDSDPVRLFKPHDAPYAFFNDGAVVRPFGPIYPMTVPILGDFSWVNQGGATIIDTNGILYMEMTTGTLTEDCHLRVKSIPTAPYTVTMGFSMLVNAVDGFCNCGMALRESSTGKFIAFADIDRSNGTYNARRPEIYRFTNPTTFASTGLTGTKISNMCAINWYRIHDDGTNRHFQISVDGYNFVTILTETNTTFMTPDQIGFYLNNPSSTGSLKCGVSIYSWHEDF